LGSGISLHTEQSCPSTEESLCPVPLSPEWYEAMDQIMNEGVDRTDENNNEHIIPPLAELKQAFVGFEREVCLDNTLHNKSFCW